MTISSGEAEYVSLSDGVSQVRGLRNLLRSLGFQLILSKVLCDSPAAIAIATTSETRQTRHVDVSFHNTREAVEKGEIVLVKVSSVENVADLYTKPLSRDKIVLLTKNVLE